MVVRVHLVGVPPGSFRDHCPIPVIEREGETYISDVARLTALIGIARRFRAEVSVRWTDGIPSVVVSREGAILSLCDCGGVPEEYLTDLGYVIRCHCGMETYGYRTLDHARTAWAKGHRHRAGERPVPTMVDMLLECDLYRVKRTDSGVTLWTLGCVTELTCGQAKLLATEIEGALEDRHGP